MCWTLPRRYRSRLGSATSFVSTTTFVSTTEPAIITFLGPADTVQRRVALPVQPRVRPSPAACIQGLGLYDSNGEGSGQQDRVVEKNHDRTGMMGKTLFDGVLCSAECVEHFTVEVEIVAITFVFCSALRAAMLTIGSGEGKLYCWAFLTFFRTGKARIKSHCY